MLCKLLVLSALCEVALTAAVEKLTKEVIPIVSQESEIFPDGNYRFNYESGDGSKAEAEGGLKVVDEDKRAAVVKGSYAYEGDDGRIYSISYIADENGYQPQGEHLPVSPDIPPAIQRALEYIATATPPTEEAEI